MTNIFYIQKKHKNGDYQLSSVHNIRFCNTGSNKDIKLITNDDNDDDDDDDYDGDEKVQGCCLLTKREPKAMGDRRNVFLQDDHKIQNERP
jgi:hypothetical protein